MRPRRDRRAADVREQHRPGCGEQARVHLGLALEHVEAGGEDHLFLECGCQRLLVDNRAARRVHENGVGLHEAQPAGVDEVPGLVGERYVQGHDVALGQQRVEVAAPADDARVMARVVQHLHAEAGGAASYGLADAAEADDAQHGAVHVAPQVLVDVPARPATGAQVGFRLPRASRRREDEQEGEVGGRLVQHTGRVAHGDAVVGCGLEVDVVVTDGDVGHDAQPGRARREHSGVDAIREQADDRVDFRRQRDDLVVREAALPVRLDQGVADLGERFEAAGREPARDQDARQSGVSARCSRPGRRP
jgi:hypothetical protein